MKDTDKKRTIMGATVSNAATNDLRGQQSVRATFRLSETCINVIGIISAQLGIKQKSVFDQILEDPEVLNKAARELENIEFDRRGRIQKTFVISRRSLAFPDTLFSRHKAPRNALMV